MIMSEGSAGEESKKKRGRPKGTKSKPKAETQTIETTKGKSKAEESESVLTAAEVAAIAEAEAKKEYEAAAAQVVVADLGNSFTYNRGTEQIFRREMGEPEFWLDRLCRAPKRTILSQDEEQEISRLVEIPTDQIPPYKPEHILSPEYDGTSNYEIGIKTQKEETQQRLVRLRSDPNASAQEINQAEEDLKTLD